MSHKVICSCLLFVLGLVMPRKGHAVNQGKLPFMLGLGPLSKRYGARQDHMLLVLEILERAESYTKTDHLYGKGTGKSLVGPQTGWSRVLGSHHGRSNSVSQVDGDSDMVPTCQLCVGGLRKGTVTSTSISVWAKAAPPTPPPDARY